MDLVYFVKRDGALDNKWTLGMIESVEKGRDGVIRKAVVKYCNSSEQKLSLVKGGDDATFPRYTERAVRKLIRVFSIEETTLAEDLAGVERRLGMVGAKVLVGEVPVSCSKKKMKCTACCCGSHCEFSLHLPSRVKTVEVSLEFQLDHVAVDDLGLCEDEAKFN